MSGVLGTRCFAGADGIMRVLQIVLNRKRKRMRASEHAPRNRRRLLEGRQGFAKIVERGAIGFAERPRVIPPQPERVFITLSLDASRHGYCFAQQ